MAKGDTKTTATSTGTKSPAKPKPGSRRRELRPATILANLKRIVGAADLDGTSQISDLVTYLEREVINEAVGES